MSDETNNPEIQEEDPIVLEAEKVKHKGRVKGTKNKNFEYKEKLRKKGLALKMLWSRGELYWKLDSLQKKLRDAYYNRKNETTLVWLLSRQVGKCVISSTYVMTPTGNRQIRDIQIGDQVIGYNSDGTSSPTTVINKIDCGIRDVHDLVSYATNFGGCTDEHVWLTRRMNGKKEISISEEKLNNFKYNTKIVRCFYNTPMGEKDIKDAYALGALIGDGCSRQGVNQIFISSEGDFIPKRLAEILNCDFKKNSGKNYTWSLHREPYNTQTKVTTSFYDDWVRGRYAHEKILVYDEVKTWNRSSILKLIAGLLDTDGSVHKEKKFDSLIIQIGMQAKEVIYTVQKLIYDLFQYQAKVITDKRSKYKNGPVLTVKINHNVFSKRILKELDQYLVTPRKKWKEEYESLVDYNVRKDFVGVKKVNPRKEQCWDITVDNDTSLYLTGDGLVTHNSYTVCTIMLEELFRNKDYRICYVAPQQNQARRIVKKTMTELLVDCPDLLRPKFMTQEGLWRFPNGAELYVVGSDAGNIEAVRGMTFNRVIVDEFCFLDDFDYCLNSVLFPTMISVHDPVMTLISSPPKTHDHPSNLWIDRAEEKETLFTATIHECPRFSKEKIQNIIDVQYHGNSDSVDFRREFLVERIPDTNSLVLPEASLSKMSELIQDLPKPLYYNAIVSADWGVMDNNFILFGYFDFQRNAIIIEEELELSGTKETAKDIAGLISLKEDILWTHRVKRKRVCDNNLQLINDLSIIYKLPFLPTAKDNLQAAVNEVRARISANEIIIHPRCIKLISQMKSATWDKGRKKFKKAKDHHYDGVAALVYLVRNIDAKSNPFPKGWNHPEGSFVSPKFGASEGYKSVFHKSMHELFTVRKTKKKSNH